MAIKQTNRGFTLLIALIFMSVMLSFGLSLGSLAYKQQVLASDATASQYAFYAADAGLECLLYADQQNNGQGSLFAYANYDSFNPNKNFMTCDGNNQIQVTQAPQGTWLRSTAQIALYKDTNGNATRCADVAAYKPSGSGFTYLFSQGYDVPCTKVGAAGVRVVARGISVHF